LLSVLALTHSTGLGKKSAKFGSAVRKGRPNNSRHINDSKTKVVGGAAKPNKVLRPDSHRYKIGIQEHLRPIHKVPDIFTDMTENALKVGLVDFLKHLNGRKLKVATMCSGTESPILALQLFGEGRQRTAKFITI
jgi:hypothetical protein